VAGIAPNVLSERLRRLEREGVLASRPYSERPVRLSYELTPMGRDLAGALRLLAAWGAGPEDEGPHHEDCGTPLQPRWHCVTCERVVDEGERGEVRLV
jgi:DNA-binding HxlR family transcriptional regulator